MVTLTEPITAPILAPPGPALQVRQRDDGALERLNDPDSFAITPELLASMSMEITIIDRTYVVVGVTEHADLVVRCVRGD